MNVYAYGVMPLYGGQDGQKYEHYENYLVIHSPYAYLHYWVDENLIYGEVEKNTSAAPELNFVANHCRVKLHGPRNYEVKIHEQP